MICRQPTRRPSAGSRPVQSRVPRSGFERRYAALAPFASSLNDASTAREEEAASTLTLLPKQRGREQAGGCQLLRFVAFLRGQSDILGSRSLVAGPCRIHASPRPSNLRPTNADHGTSPCACQGPHSIVAWWPPVEARRGLRSRSRFRSRLWPRPGPQLRPQLRGRAAQRRVTWLVACQIPSAAELWSGNPDPATKRHGCAVALSVDRHLTTRDSGVWASKRDHRAAGGGI